MVTAFGDKPPRRWDDEDLLVLLAWGAGALLVALRFFRWMPRRA